MLLGRGDDKARLSQATALVWLIGCILAATALPARELAVNDPQGLKKALKEARPGDDVVLREGEWKDQTLVFDANGTKENPITLRARTPGQTVFTGHSLLKLGGEFLEVRGLLFKNGSCPGGSALAFRSNAKRAANNSRITDCAVINYNPPSTDAKSYWVSFYGVSNRVDHCRFEGKNDGGPTLTVWLERNGQPNYHLIDHNSFVRRPNLGRNGGETMRIGDSDTSFENSRTTVEFNYFEDCSGEAEYISNKSCENLYRFNTFVECKGALVLRHGYRCTVEGNWFFGHHVPGTGGIRIIGEDQRVVNNYLDSLDGTDFESALPFVNGIPNTKLNGYFQIKRAVVAFNTLVDCKQSLTFGVGAGRRKRLQPPADCVIANNLIVSTNGPLVRLDDKPANPAWLGNLFFGAPTGLPETPGIVTAEPWLRRGAGGIARPAPGSPAIGSAQGEFPYVTADIEGRPPDGEEGCRLLSSFGGAVAPRASLRARERSRLV